MHMILYRFLLKNIKKNLKKGKEKIRKKKNWVNLTVPVQCNSICFIK